MPPQLYRNNVSPSVQLFTNNAEHDRHSIRLEKLIVGCNPVISSVDGGAVSGERHWLTFTSSSSEVIFSFSTVSTGPDLGSSQVRSVCEPISDSSPDIVCSLEMP
jgi:hypothetical protein